MTGLSDRELFRRAVKNLPRMLPSILLVQVIYRLIGTFAIKATAQFRILFYSRDREDILAGLLIILFAVGIIIVGMALSFLGLGIHRYCLLTGEGKTAGRPWSIFQKGVWKRHISWCAWSTFLSTVWTGGSKLLQIFLMTPMDDQTANKINGAISYINGVAYVISLLFINLIFLSMCTAFLRAPKRGFWTAVVYGIKEGVKKWPKTIGAQLKFVVSVSLGVSAVNLLTRLAFQMGDADISTASSLIGLLLAVVAEIWIMVFGGFLAAERYDPPEEYPEE